MLCPEGRGIFPGMTVTENLNMGAYTRKDKAAIDEDFDRVFGLFPRLLERRKQIAGTMSGGEQQMLAIGRALMSRPKLLHARRAVDGPGPDADPADLRHHHRDRRSRARPSWSWSRTPSRRSRAADRAYVLETGKIVKTGTGAELLDDPSVREAYLGVA